MKEIENVVEKVREAVKANTFPSEGVTVSGHTKRALKICRDWQEKYEEKDFHIEKKVHGKSSEKIDLVDCKNQIAFELKVSGKNAHHEFYKDLCKVISHNLEEEKNPLKTFVFITQCFGKKAIDSRLSAKFIQSVKENYNIKMICKSYCPPDCEGQCKNSVKKKT